MKTCFPDQEQTVIWKIINVEHECIFCVPANTAMAKHMKIFDDVSHALRDETLLPTAKLEALRAFTLEVVCARGYASKDAIANFLSLGHTHQNI